MISLRDLNQGDCKRVFDWRNDVDSIAVSQSLSGVKWASHQAWFPKQIASDDVIGLMAEQYGVPFCVVWLHREDKDWIVSINMDPAFRHHGRGTKVLALALDRVRGESLRAVIREDNKPSVRLFKRAGFVPSHALGDGFEMYVRP